MRTLPWFYYFANWFLRTIFFPLTLKVEFEGLEKVPLTGPLIVVINHINFLDPLLTGAYFPREIEMMSKVENFRLPVVGWVVKAYGAFPVRRGEADVVAIKHALQVLQQGRALLMAPEGTRGSAILREGHDGAALLAARSGAPLIPVGVSGQEHFFRNLKRLRRTTVRVSVGDPFYLTAGTRKPTRDTLRVMTEELMQRLAAELPPTYRGAHQAVRGPGRFARPMVGHLSAHVD